MRALKFITGHMIFKLRYNQIYQLKTTVLEIESFLKKPYFIIITQICICPNSIVVSTPLNYHPIDQGSNRCIFP